MGDLVWKVRASGMSDAELLRALAALEAEARKRNLITKDAPRGAPV
jgi:hypothetical protein